MSVVVAWLNLQLALCIVALLAWGLDRLHLDPRQWVLAVRAWIVVLPLVVFAPRWASDPVPHPAPMAPVMQEIVAQLGDPAVPAEVSRPASSPPIPWGLGLLGLGIAGATLRLVVRARALSVQLRRTTVVRRIGRVEIRVGDAGYSYAVGWGRRAIVVLDRAVHADPQARWIVARHELIHHRHADPRWAWAWVVLEAIALPLPALAYLRRRTVAMEELANDAVVVRRVDPAAYARVLLAAACPTVSPSLAAPAAARHSLHERIPMLVRPRSMKIPLIPAVAVGLALQLAWGGVAPAAPPVEPCDSMAYADLGLGGITAPAAVEMLDGYVTSAASRRFFAAALERHTHTGAEVDAALVTAGLPLALAAVPLVESGFAALPPHQGASGAPPGPRGAGLWMFIPSTARTYGLQVDDTRDDRMDVALATDAAIALLTDLHAHYDDWGLALAGYNQGQKHVDAAIEAHGTRDVRALIEAGALNDYVARIAAATVLLEDPRLVGG